MEEILHHYFYFMLFRTLTSRVVIGARETEYQPLFLLLWSRLTSDMVTFLWRRNVLGRDLCHCIAGFSKHREKVWQPFSQFLVCGRINYLKGYCSHWKHFQCINPSVYSTKQHLQCFSFRIQNSDPPYYSGKKMGLNTVSICKHYTKILFQFSLYLCLMYFKKLGKSPYYIFVQSKLRMKCML